MVTRWEFVNPPPAEIRTPLFEEMDYNNDGLLSRREWPVDARAFDRADRNHDGIVTLREFASSANEDPNQDSVLRIPTATVSCPEPSGRAPTTRSRARTTITTDA